VLDTTILALQVDPPDVQGRVEILKVHAKDRKMKTTFFFLVVFFYFGGVLFFLPFFFLVLLGKRTEVSFPFGNMFSGGLLVLGRVKTGWQQHPKNPGPQRGVGIFFSCQITLSSVTNAYGNLTKKEANSAQGEEKTPYFQ